MTFILNDRVKQTISSTGTGNLTLGGTSSGYVSFENGIGDGNTTYYAIENLPSWEVGIGTYNNGTLTRDIILNSSNNGNPIDITISSTPSIVFCNYPAEKSVILDPSGMIRSSSSDYNGVQFPDGTVQSTSYRTHGRAYRNITEDTTLNEQDDFVFIDTTSGDVRVILPLSDDMDGRTITFKFIAGSGQVIIETQGGDEIDSKSSFVMEYINQSISTFSNRNNWYIV
jgi:hypothetical protein